MKNFFSIILIALVFLCLFGCNLGSSNETPRTENNSPANSVNQKAENKPESTVTNRNEETAGDKPIRSTELVEAFKKDKAAANAKYKDKTILISGKITNINDVFGVKALNLRDNETASGLQTYLANKADVEKVKVGDEVVVRGKVRGDDTDVIDGAVIIKVN
jgi:predicted small lipoprotein YifL